MSAINELRDKLSQEIKQAIIKSGLVTAEEIPDFVIEIPKDTKNGDFATNVAMQLTKIAKQAPRAIAEAIRDNLDLEEAAIERLEIAGPGFINFFMSYDYLYQTLADIFRLGIDYGQVNVGQGEKIQIEFVSANPTGDLHLGHARWAALGDALANLLEAAGYEITREYYINDAGNQIDNLGLSVYARYLEALGQESQMPEGGYFGQDIIQIGQDLASEYGDIYVQMPETDRHQALKSLALDKKLASIKKDLADFGVDFDVWFSERSLYADDTIPNTIAQMRAAGYIYEEEGAVWFASTRLGDDKDRVLVKGDGSYTYLTPDIAYHLNKFNRGFDKVINIWGQDHHGYVARMKAAMTALGLDSDRLIVLLGQLVNLYENGEPVRMSKRTGKAVTMAELVDEVGLDATRYFFLMRGLDTHLDFDLDLAKSQSNENPVYYVQYAHARIASIVRQVGELDWAGSYDPSQVDWKLLASDHEINLIKKLADLPSEIAYAATAYAPHRIVRYAFDLATAFHSFYGVSRVISEDVDLGLSHARYGLVLAVQQTLQNVFKILGISAPERM